MDRTVDWQHNLRVLEDKFSSPEVFFLEKARHHLANEGESIRREYLRWLGEQFDEVEA